MHLREWLKLYLRHRDAFTKKLVTIEEEGDLLVCTYKDRTSRAHAWESLKESAQGETLIATLQTKENVEYLIEHWKVFVKNENLTILFVNPEQNEKWAIKPALHDRIAGEELRAGIYSMAESTTFV